MYVIINLTVIYPGSHVTNYWGPYTSAVRQAVSGQVAGLLGAGTASSWGILTEGWLKRGRPQGLGFTMRALTLCVGSS